MARVFCVRGMNHASAMHKENAHLAPLEPLRHSGKGSFIDTAGIETKALSILSVYSRFSKHSGNLASCRLARRACESDYLLEVPG